MNILLVFIATALAIGGLVMLNAWLGGWTPSRITSLEDAIARMKNDYLDFEPADAIIASDEKAVLVLDASGDRVGFVEAQGDILIPRLLTASDIRSVSLNDSSLKIALNDFTFPTARIVFASEGDAKAWQNKLLSLKEVAHA